MKYLNIFLLSLIILFFACKGEDKTEAPVVPPTPPVVNSDTLIMRGGDFSISKKLIDDGGMYTFDGVEMSPWEIFSENNYNYARLRLFNHPDGVGPVCQDLPYVIESALAAKAVGMKILLDFHYSDTWADPAHQWVPEAWEGLELAPLSDSVYAFTQRTLREMERAGVLPEVVQIGNEVTPGMMWPVGKIYKTSGEDWNGFVTLLKSGISAVRAYNSGNNEIEIMVHIDKGGDKGATQYFFDKLESYSVDFDMIGLSYYPFWHGSFSDLRENLSFCSTTYTQEIVIVETAYYSEGWYPDPHEAKPYPATPEGQSSFMDELIQISAEYEKVTGIFYWKPDGIELPGSGVTYLGRSLFSPSGEAYPAIRCFDTSR